MEETQALDDPVDLHLLADEDDETIQVMLRGNKGVIVANNGGQMYM